LRLGPIGDDPRYRGHERQILYSLFRPAETGPVEGGTARGIADGACCRIDIIDTWNMKVASIKSIVTLKKKGAYHVAGARNEVVKLPKRPFMALRIRIVD